MKKFFSLLLVICMIVNIGGILPVNAGELIMEGACGENLTWTLDIDGVLTISGTGKMDEWGWDDWNYEFVYAPWVEYSELINSVIINDGVTSIGNYAFESCYNLTSAEISCTVISIAEEAFYQDNLIIKGYTNSEAETFATNFGYIFESMGEMPIAIVTEGVYGENLIYTLDTYGTLTISGTGSTPEFGDEWSWFLFLYEFGGNIKQIVIENGITMISYGSFSDCYNLISVTIPESVTIIDEGAFYGCDNLESVEIPYTVSTIGVEAFPSGETFIIKGYEYSAAESFAAENGNTFVSLGSAPCITLAEGTCGENLTWKLNSYGVMTISGTGAMTDWNSSSDVPWYAYRKKINSVELNDGITNIGYYAFYSCGLATVKIPNSVTKIGGYAFSYCDNLTSVEIPYTVTYIGYKSFEEGEGLVIRGYQFSKAEEFAAENGNKFASIGKMPVVTVAEGTCGENLTWKLDNYGVMTISGTGKMDDWGWITYEIDENLFMEEFVDAPWDEYEGSIEYVVINIGVTSIGDYAFYNCYNLESVEIPYTVTHIDDDAISTGVLIKGYKYSYAEFFATENGYTFESVGDAPAEGSCGEGLTWELDDYGAMTISGSGEMDNWGNNSDVPWYYYAKEIKSVTINRGVNSIGEKAFYDCSNLTSIAILDSVNSIGESAFYNCSSLTSIEIPDGVTVIPDYTFYGCSSLTGIKIPDSVNSIGEKSFYNCSNLTSIEIPDSVISIGKSAFDSCSSLTSIEIPDGVTVIPDYTFYGCSSLTGIKIPDSVIRVGYKAFSGCLSLTDVYYCGDRYDWNAIDIGVFNDYLEDANIHHDYKDNTKSDLTYTFDSNTGVLTISGTGDMDSYESKDAPWHEVRDQIISVIIENGVTSIGDCAFEGCYNLTSVIIGDSVTNIGEDAFSGCEILTSVTIPDSVNSIGESAFYNCSSLTSIEIPDGVTVIPDYAFYGCSSLERIVIPDGVTDIYKDAFSNCESLRSVTIPDSVEYIGSYAFGDCKDLENIKIPSSVTSIGYGAFKGCETLESITIPEGVISIKQYTFEECYSLEEIVIPDSVTVIGNGAFGDCSNLKEIIIPDNVTSIEPYAFYGCSSLTDVYYTGSEDEWEEIEIGSCNEELTSANIYFELNKTYVVAEGVCGIDLTWALDNEGCLAISGTGLMLSWNSDERVPWHDYVDSIKCVVIGDGVTNIGRYAFAYCDNLESVLIPDGVTNIYDDAFRSCDKLANITIPDSVEYIGRSVFLDCKRLKATYDGTWEDWENVSIDSGNENLTRYIQFGDNEGLCGNKVRWQLDLESGVLKMSGVGKMADYGNTSYFDPSTMTIRYTDTAPWYENRYKINKVVIEEGVTSIGEIAFRNCEYLNEIEIPESVASIGYNAFYGTDIYNDESNWIDGVLYIGNALIEAETDLTGVYNVRAGTSVIADFAFYYTGLTEVKISGGDISIGQYAFSKCNRLANVEISGDDIVILEYAFKDCTALTSITLPENVNDLAFSTFYGCSNLSDIYYMGSKWKWENLIGSVMTFSCNVHFGSLESGVCGETLTWILDDEGCLTVSGTGKMNEYASEKEVEWYPFGEYVKFVKFENGVKNIEDHAFSGCSNLENVTMADSITFIGRNAFYGCDRLTSVYVNDVNSWVGIEFENEYSSPIKNGADVYVNGTRLREFTSIVISEGITRIGSFVFYGCVNLSEITIPDSVTVIGDCAFGDCSNLKEIIIPDSVTNIGFRAFEGCYSLEEIVIPDSVTDISYSAFMGCYGLKSAVIGNELSYLSGALFEGCSSLKKIKIGDGVKDIYNMTFAGCTALEEITIPDNVTIMRKMVFSDCTNLKRVKLGNGLVAFDALPFEGCSSLQEIIIPDSVRGIHAYLLDGSAYYDDEENWEDGVLYVGNHLIQAKTSLEGSYRIKEGTVTIASDAFRDCNELTDITIPSSVKEIEFTAFYNCEMLNDVTIGSGVEVIGDYAFYDCYNLTSVTIGGGVTDIGEGAFKECSDLTDVYYIGTEEDWNQIIIDEENDSLLNATIHFVVPEIKDLIVTKEGEDAIVTIDLEGTEAGGIIRGVVIDDSIAKEFQSDNAEEEVTLEFDNVNKGTIIKVFWWESYESMRPLCEAKTIIIE